MTMGAMMHTDTQIRIELERAAESGTTTSAREIAEALGLSRSTVQRYGRERETILLGGRWVACYEHGDFRFTELRDPDDADDPHTPHHRARADRFARVQEWLTERERNGALPDQRPAAKQIRDLVVVAELLGLYAATEIIKARLM